MPRKKKLHKYWVNEGIYEIIRDGFDQGLTINQISQELPYSRQTLYKVQSGEYKPNSCYTTKLTYETIKAHPEQNQLRQDILQSKDYYQWSLKHYARVNKVSGWGKKNDKPKEEPIMQPETKPEEESPRIVKFDIKDFQKPKCEVCHKQEDDMLMKSLVVATNRQSRLKSTLCIWTMALISFVLLVAAVCIFRLIGLI